MNTILKKMTYSATKRQTFFLLALLPIALLMCLVVNQVVQAGFSDPLSLDLTVNGGVSANVINGNTVLLEWAIDGPVTSCQISDGATSFPVDVSTLPAVGSQTVTPPANSQTNYVLSCDSGGPASVVTYIVPEVTLTSRNPNPQTATDGYVYLAVDWTSQFATECNNFWYTKESNPSYKVILGSGSVDYLGNTSGYIHRANLTETYTVYATCTNTFTGVSGTGSLTVDVINAGATIPTLNISSPQAPSVAMNEIWGYAKVDVSYTTDGTSWCTYTAYDASDNPYVVPGFSTTYYRSASTFSDLRISERTRFEITCGRPALTIGGVTYPATSITDSITVDVSLPAGVTSLATWDRTTLPQATVSVAADPNPVTANPLSGQGAVKVTVNRSDVDTCDYKAYELSTGTEYPILYWTGDGNPGNTPVYEKSFNIATSTRFEAYCYRSYDLLYGTAAEIARGSATAYVDVILNPSVGALPPPQAHIYANSVYYPASQIDAIATANDYVLIGSNPGLLRGNWDYVPHEISFPFQHPYGSGQTDLYDIFIHTCDDTDGAVTYEVSTADDGMVGSIVTDSPQAIALECNGIAQKIPRLVASNVSLTDGEIVTLHCNGRNAAEICRLWGMMFGAGDGGTVSATIDPALGYLQVPVMWVGEDVRDCSAPWTTANGSLHFSTEFVTASTTYDVTCGRAGDALTDTNDVDINIIGAGSGASIAASIATGACVDEFGVFGVPAGTLISSTTAMSLGIGPDVNGFCSQEIDLEARIPWVPTWSLSNPDPITGTYDGLKTRFAIENLGPGDLPAGSAITYKTRIVFMPGLGMLSTTSPVGVFNGAIAAGDESSILNRTYDNIPFGSHGVCSDVNLDGSPNFAEATLDNNSSCRTVTVPVPEPPMSISVEPPLTNLKGATISWSVHTAYQMDCIVAGPGGVNEVFRGNEMYLDADPTNDGPYTGSVTTGTIENKSVYALRCVEPLTGTTFTKTAEVEVVPKIQEL